VTLLRALVLFVPFLCAWALVLRRTRAEATGALLATLWNLPALLALDVGARALGWWKYGTSGGGLAGMPVDVWLGWALAWGAVPALAFRRGILAPVTLAVGVDVVALPLLAPVVELGPRWLLGETLGVAAGVVPAVVLARLTAERRHTGVRAALQLVAFGGLTLGIFPLAAFALRGGGFGNVVAQPRWVLGLAAQVLAVPALFAASAVQEFAERGGGTPVPLDPPRRLVTTGPYAYVANPMQLGMTLLLVGYGALLGSWWVAAIGPVGAVFSSGFAAWQEHGDLDRRYGQRCHAYRAEVRAWLPRWRPRHQEPALLHLAVTCEPCTQLARWLDRRAPLALEVVPAEDAPLPLDRMTYVPADGTKPEDGVRALGRALEHLNLGWALIGFTMRLPVVRAFLQLVVDAVGGGRRAVPTVVAPARLR
jgi:protein-S-isoprenylcysteine O-methyltransferase Ste14